MIMTKTPDTKDRQILELSSDGKTMKEIAKDFKVSHRSIEYRVNALKSHYKCKSLIQLIAKYNSGKITL